MGLSLSATKKTIEVISFLDDAVGCTREVYQEYLKELDESLLELDPAIEPTKFVLQSTLSLKQLQMIKKEQAIVKNEGVEFNLGYMITEVQCALVDIKNPPEGLQFKRNKDGVANDEIVAILESMGILSDLFVARQNSQKTSKADTKKNLAP